MGDVVPFPKRHRSLRRFREIHRLSQQDVATWLNRSIEWVSHADHGLIKLRELQWQLLDGKIRAQQRRLQRDYAATKLHP